MRKAWTNKQLAELRKLYERTYPSREAYSDAISKFACKYRRSRQSVLTQVSSQHFRVKYHEKTRITIYLSEEQKAEIISRTVGTALSRYIVETLFNDNRNDPRGDSLTKLDGSADLSAPLEQLGSKTVLRGGVADG